MSWMSHLYEYYENQAVQSENPIAHMNANAQVEVSINRDGEFVGAREIEKDVAVTTIPVTESSAGRASGIAPHPLCDMLPYVAGDYAQYCKGEKEKKQSRQKHERYMEGLENWCDSEDSHPKVRAIHAYLSKGKLIADLIRAGIVEIGEDHTFSAKKIEGKPYDKAMVRFRVLGCGPEPSGTWEDGTLIQAYASYYTHHLKGDVDVCYFLGNRATVATNHPKGLIAASYGAKLVSANDSQGYTYRGRFQDEKQASALSYEASQKIHGALTWLVKKQGVTVGTKEKRTFVCWNTGGHEVPDIVGELGLEDNGAEDPVSYKKKLSKFLQGYREQFSREDEVIVMGLEAATTGRLSITYYNELMANDFLDRVLYWGETCCWYYRDCDEKNKPGLTVKTPQIRKIVEAAYGNEKDSWIGADDKIMREQVQRLLKCMVESQPIPLDLVRAITAKASSPMRYKHGRNRETVLSTACAIIAKYHRDKKGRKEGEETDMVLDAQNRDRSYLFGRLLAVAEKVERRTYERGESREPNAIRLQSVFVNHPLHTWNTIYLQLEPYFRKLNPGTREYYRNLIAEIFALFQEEDAPRMNQGLGETYLLGYFLQRKELNQKSDAQGAKGQTTEEKERENDD